MCIDGNVDLMEKLLDNAVSISHPLQHGVSAHARTHLIDSITVEVDKHTSRASRNWRQIPPRRWQM